MALLGGDLEAITTALIEKARAGESWAIKLVLDKLVPNAKSTPVSFPLPSLEGAGGLRQGLAAILAEISLGRLTPDEGQAVAQVMGVLGLAVQVEELERKLAEIVGVKK